MKLNEITDEQLQRNVKLGKENNDFAKSILKVVNEVFSEYQITDTGRTIYVDLNAHHNQDEEETMTVNFLHFRNSHVVEIGYSAPKTMDIASLHSDSEIQKMLRSKGINKPFLEIEKHPELVSKIMIEFRKLGCEKAREVTGSAWHRDPTANKRSVPVLNIDSEFILNKHRVKEEIVAPVRLEFLFPRE